MSVAPSSQRPLPRGQTRHWVVAGKEVTTMLPYGLGIDWLQPVFPLLLRA